MTAIVGEVLDDGSADIIGIGVAESHGIRRGVVVNVEAAVESIKKAIDEAELTAGVEIDSVHLAPVRGRTSRGSTAAAWWRSPARTARSRARTSGARSTPPRPWRCRRGREILHVLPQDFVVDDQDGIGAPVGMTGARLEVNVHIVTGSASSTQNMVACVNRAGVEVADTVLEQLAASESVLTPDEKELGVALLDIGGGTTDLAIFERGSLWHTAVIASAATTSPTTSPSACGCRSPTRRSSSGSAGARCPAWSTRTRRSRSPASAAGARA